MQSVSDSSRNSVLQIWKSSRPGSLARDLYHRLFRLQTRLRCWYADRFRRLEAGVELPPAMLRFRVSECISAHEFVRVGQGCAQIIAAKAKAAGRELGSAGRVLDFGLPRSHRTAVSAPCSMGPTWMVGKATRGCGRLWTESSKAPPKASRSITILS